MRNSGKKPKILYVVGEDWAFLSHRLPMANAAQALGWQVVVATNISPDSRHRRTIEDKGFRVLPVAFKRGSMNPFAELSPIMALVRIMREEKPDVVHNIALKPVLDGSIAALFSPAGQVINSFTGLGAIFTDSKRFGVLRALLSFVFRHLMDRANTWVVVQNEDDLMQLKKRGIGTPSRTVKICGSGVNTAVFRPSDKSSDEAADEAADVSAGEPDGPVTVTMVSRLLWDKGVGELVEAARILHQNHIPVRIRIVGTADSENPQSIDDHTITGWQKEGLIEFQGYREDIAGVWSQSHIAVLPSYREGLPKSLLEAAACGKPMIATDVPGCRELVRHGVNGLLVPVRDPSGLAEAIAEMAKDTDLRRSLGQKARAMIEERFSDTVIMGQIAELYQSLLEQSKTG